MKNRVNRASSEAKKNLSVSSSEAKKNLSFSSSEAMKNLSFSSSEAMKNNWFFTMRAEKELSAIRGEQTLVKQPTNHPLITHLLPTFGSRLDAIRKYAAMVVLMLLIGVGNVWGGTVSGGEIYFDATQSGWGNSLSSVEYIISHDGYSCWYAMTKIPNTNLYHISSDSWGDSKYFAFTGNYGWTSCEGNSYDSRKGYGPSGKKYTAKSTYGVNSGSTYLFYASSSANDASITTSSPAGYLGSGKTYTALNYTQTLQQTLSTDGGSTFSTSTASIATVKVSSYKLNGASSSASNSGTIAAASSSTSCSAARTATVTYTVSSVATGYEFVGWYDGSTEKSTSTTYTYNATAAKTITARFKETQYSLTFSHNGHGTIKVGGSTISSGSTANVNHFTTKTLVATANTGYHFAGWTKSGSNTSAVTIGDESETSTTIKATNTGATITAVFEADASNYTLTFGAGSNGSVSAKNTSTAAALTSGSEYASGTGVTVTATPNTHYHLEGWYSDAGLTTPVGGAGTTNPYSFSLTSNTAVYAKFALNQCAITLDRNGGTAGDESVTATYGSTLPSFTAHTRSGYTLNGYFTATSDGTKIINADGSLVAGTSYADGSNKWNSDDSALELHAQWTENKRDVTISAGTGGTVDKTNASVGVATTTTVSATAYPGYRFTGWTATNCSVTSTSNASTTLKGNGTTGDATLVANFARTYAYIQGRMTVYNATRTSETHVGSSKGKWDENSTRVAMEYDETNHRFLRHTYKTPKELTATQTDGTAQSQWFSIKTSTSSSSLAGVTTYHPSSNTDITTVGNANKKAAQTSTTTSNYKFNSSTTTGYVILYFDETGVWYELEQTLKYNGNGGTGSAPATAYYLKGTNATAAAASTFSKTGYTFNGWNTVANGSGTSYAAGASVPMNSNITLYAQWTPKNYTVTLNVDEEHKGTIAGATTSQSVTYNAATTTVLNRPTGAQGYGLDGYYTDHNGAGTKLIKGDGTWIASVAGYTDADKKWIHDGDVTLYAYYKQSVITGITFTGGSSVFDTNGSSVEVTANLDPTPGGSTVVCWRVLYSSNNNPLESQPTFSPASGTTVSFNAPTTPGSYKIEATLRTGSECGSGTVLSTYKEAFQIASDHTVTVQYTCGSDVIAPSTTTSGKPLEWTEVVAHEIFGYTFSGWTAGDGITLEAVTAARLAALKAADPTVAGATNMKAIYDGKLTANYTKKDFIYFKSTALKWNDVYVYFYTDGGYWDNNLGAGATGAACIGKGKMDLVPGETDVYYWDYGAHIEGGASAATKYVAFTWGDCTGHNNFNGKSSCYPMNGNNQGFSSGTPMFVPIAQSENYRKNNNATPYFDRGYWTRYTGGTGYSVDIFYANGNYDKSFDFVEGATAGMPYTATVYLNGGSNLYFKVHRSSDIYYYSTTNVTMSNATTSKALTYDSGASNKTTITTNVAGEYTFTLTCGSDGKLNVSVKYPAATGDYRLVYSDGTQTKPLVSDIVPKVNNGKDTVSFFVRPGKTPVLKVQQASISGGTLRWNEGTNITTAAGLTSLAKDSVYNICLKMDGSGTISVENVEGYTGNYYIRTDAANNKWDNYRSADHVMTYSEYSELNSDFTHYWVKFVNEGTNVTFVVANDYSPNISDTLKVQTYRGGDGAHVDVDGKLNSNLEGDGVNIRYMWHRKTNAVIRAYLAPAQRDGSKFLVLRANSATDLMDEDGHALTSSNNHGAPNNSMQFTDDENWIYETTVMVKPGAYVKLYGHFHGTDFYFKGNNNDSFNSSIINGNPNAIQLITGSGDAQKVRVIFDFKTDRLLAAWLPSGEINQAKEINADVMFIREHQGDMAQLTFSGEGKITAIKSAYGVMRFNKWTLNNKDKSTHAVLGSPKSIYERSLYFISFPFRVKLNDVFGFGKYMEHWAIQKYNGARRAAEGFWLESSGFWEWMDRNTEYLEPNQGYLLAIDLDLLGEDNHDIWGPESRSEQIELYFPSYGDMPNITSANVTQTIPSHACEIDWSERPNGHGGTLGPEYNRTIIDSHWNVLSVPTYVNTSNIAFANTTWTTAIGPNFLYTWNMDDNTLTATAAAGYTYHAMHAYMVQYGGNVTWSASSGSPYPIVARRTYAEKPKETSFCMEIQQEGKMIDRTYVVLSSDEETKTEFSFGEDMGKEFNTRNANIYTVVENYIPTAGNTLPMSEQTTVVPVGVKVNKAGKFTFAMPEGTDGTGAVLVDNTTGTRTNLALTDYTVTLEKGDCEGRFTLEISPVANTPTGNLTPALSQGDGEKVRKVIVDGVLYIVKDDKIYDARGNRIN